jgi:Fe-Mn family superoxide dismutase
MFKLPDLPYAYNALEPVLSETTMRTHHDKHHAKYVDTVNSLLAETGETSASLEDVVRDAVAHNKTKLANNAGQAWNHAFFWEAMTPVQSAPATALVKAIDTAFGGFDAFKDEFVKQGTAHFGSGWVWLVAKGDKLSVITLHDGAAPLIEAGVTPILTCDVWEHAYYLDFKNDREGFLKLWIAKLANWSFADAQFAAATGDGEGYRYPAALAKAA